MIVACIKHLLAENFWVGLGVIFSATLSTLLIWQTIKISARQLNLQKDIQKDNETLQKEISKNNIAFQEKLFDNNAKIALYKYRTDCYLSVIEATDLFFELNIKSVIAILQKKDTQLEILQDLSKLKSILFRASHEAKVLFSEDVFNCYAEHRDLSIKLYNLWFAIITNPVEIASFQEKLYAILGTTADTISGNDIVQLMGLLNNNDNVRNLIDEYSAIKNFMETSQKLDVLLRSDKIDTLVKEYIDVKNLGKK